MFEVKSFWHFCALPVCAGVLIASGCADNPTVGNTALGAGVGAAAGGLLGNTRGAVIGAGVGALGGYAWSQYMEGKKAQMERATAGTGVQVTQTADNRLELYVPNDISFAVNSSAIEPRLRPVLDQFAGGMSAETGIEVVIIGHTDSSGNDTINDPLSLARADSVRAYLARRGLNGAQMRTEGRGSHQPLVSNDTATGRARNRRVEIFLGQRF